MPEIDFDMVEFEDGIRVEKYLNKSGLTADQMKEIIGWTTEEENMARGVETHPGSNPDDYRFWEDYLLTDTNKDKIRCTKNLKNRPFNYSWCSRLAQDILNSGPGLPDESRRWQFNGETIIVSNQGNVISGQHRGIALILANQMWESDETGHWKEIWPTPPTLDCLVVHGVSEEHHVLRTIDNVKPRTLSDVLYTMDDTYVEGTPKVRAKLCRYLDYAIRFLWSRTGQELDAFAPKRTHGEAIDFVNRHPKLIECVQVIYDISKRQKSILEDCIGIGYAAGLLYLMGSSDSKPEKYENMTPPSEDGLKWGRWKDAVKFWETLADGDPKSDNRNVFKALRMARMPMEALGEEASETDGFIFVKGKYGGSNAERVACIVKCWYCWVEGKTITPKRIELKYEQDDNGLWHMPECPAVGGIDLGDPKEQEEEVEGTGQEEGE